LVEPDRKLPQISIKRRAIRAFNHPGPQRYCVLSRFRRQRGSGFDAGCPSLRRSAARGTDPQFESRSTPCGGRQRRGDPAGGGREVQDAGAVRAVIPLGTAPSSVAVGGGSVWVLDADDKTISRIDPDRRRRTRIFSISSTPTDIAVGAGAIWVGNAFRSGRFTGTSYPESISRLDPIGVPVQERQIEAIAQKLVMLGGKVLLDGLQVLREGL